MLLMQLKDRQPETYLMVRYFQDYLGLVEQQGHNQQSNSHIGEVCTSFVVSLSRFQDTERHRDDPFSEHGCQKGCMFSEKQRLIFLYCQR